jgi:hypothetical protein
MRPILLSTLILAGAAAPTRAAPARPAPRPPALPVLTGLKVQPSQFTLAGPRAEQQLVVTGVFSDGQERDLTDHARYVSLNPKAISVVPGGRVAATAEGRGQVKAAVGRFAALAGVTAQPGDSAAPVSFRDEVQPILTRSGCNQGACHGAAAGKGGFRLSLLGWDSEADWTAVVRQHQGRRVLPAVPEQSLLLRKAALAVPHAGGMRFKPGSAEYATLRRWIGEKAPGPRSEEPDVAGLEVTPGQRITHLGVDPAAPARVAIPQPKGPPGVLSLLPRQRLAVIARYKDGSTADVTRRAQFNPLNEGLAQVDGDGVVTVAARGEAAVMVRYRGVAAIARFTQPYRRLTTFPPVAGAGFVDDLVAARWREMGLTPSPRAGDAEYLRRVYLDLIGTLPTPEEVRAFLASAEPDKRRKLVDALLNRPEYVDYWALKWGDLLRNNSDKTQPKGMWSFYNWLRAAFRENRPADRFARDLITAQGSAYTTGPANYFRVATNPADQAEATAQVFLGVRLTCAKCHHHPFEKWTQDDYWQMAAFFARVRLKGSQEFGLFGGEQVVWLAPNGEVSNPRTGKVMKPTPLDGEPADDPIDRRRALAGWMTAPQNPFFARNLVNRYWGYLMGRGIVEPIDDLRVTNPPSNPALLDALAKDFAASGYDFKHLLRTIATSETYQLSSRPTPENKLDEVFSTKYLAKRMSAEELLDAVNFATGTAEKFQNLPPGIRAIQLPDPNVPHYFLDTFGRPARQITCECERAVEPNMTQALHLMNSDFVHNKVAAGDGRVAKLLAAKKPEPEIVEELYLVTFSRPPSAAETEKALQLVAAAPSKKEGFEDLLWALINSREFLFKH